MIPAAPEKKHQIMQLSVEEVCVGVAAASAAATLSHSFGVVRRQFMQKCEEDVAAAAAAAAAVGSAAAAFFSFLFRWRQLL